MAALVVAAALGGCNLFDSNFVTACEGALLETLKSPSSYKRITVTEQKRPITFAEYWRGRPLESESVRLFQEKMAKEPPTQHVALVEYDAANVYGALTRARSMCTYDTLSASPNDATKHLVRIDGKTITDRLVDDARRAMTIPR